MSRWVLFGALGLGAAVLPKAASAEGTCLAEPHALLADLGLHVVNVAYQHTLDCYAVLQVSAGLYVPWTVTRDVLGLGGGRATGDAATDLAGGVVRVRSFLFPTGSAPTGFWISPFYQLGYVRAASETTDLHGLAQASGVTVGGTFRIATHWQVALGGGAQFHLASLGGTTAEPGFALPGPAIDLNVGYAFE
jgi:hypothetical protein